MFLGIIVLITALTISAVAIYYSVAGLVAIFAAAAVPIIIMGGALEIGKLVTAVWLHRYWHQATWWLKSYLTLAVVVLMFITSMGIFGFLSKAHIEQAAAASEGIAQIERIESEIARQEALIVRSEEKISKAEDSTGNQNSSIQAQIDTEQQRIDSAYERIQPAVQEQNRIIEDARAADSRRTEPFEQQLAALEQQLSRINEQIQQAEQRLQDLTLNTSSADPILAQIANIEESISLVQGQLAGGEREAVQAAQRTIGVDDDGAAGPNTRRAADAWIAEQRNRITELQGQANNIRQQSRETFNNERQRLADSIASLSGEQTDSVKQRQTEILAAIDQVRSTESPVIVAARDEINRLRQSADAQVERSQELIQRLRESLTIGTDDAADAIILEETQKIREANQAIDQLVGQQYTLQAEYRKLEAEVGPVKYLAEFVYGETADQDLLEEAVRWVILIIIFVFDPLAVLLLIASQYTFALHKDQTPTNSKPKKKSKPTLDLEEVEEDKHDNEWTDEEVTTESSKTFDLAKFAKSFDTAQDDGDERIKEALSQDEQARLEKYEEMEQNLSWKDAKTLWKDNNPNESIKIWKKLYIQGKVDKLPWEDELNDSYVQNGEQSNPATIWKNLNRD
jgi:hypothetical protein